MESHSLLASPPRRPALTLCLPLALLVASSCSSTEPTQRPVLAAPVRVEATTLDLSPDAARLRSDVAWLAADAREGRRSGTDGERMAASWLAGRFAELGLEPAGEQGYLQSLSVPLEPETGGQSWILVKPGANSSTAVEPTTFDDPKQVAALFCSASGGADAPLVFAGYGMRNEDRAWDDYDGGKLEGAVVVIVRGTPALPVEQEADVESSPHGRGNTLPFGSSGSIFNKVMTARHMGASAVLLAQHPSTRGEELLPFHNGHSAEASIPALTINVEVASALVPGFVDRVAAIDARALESGERLASSMEVLGQVALSSDVRRGKGMATNVLGLLPGADRSRVVVLGAHFDHLGLGGTGSLARSTWGEIHNGADDNASGTAVVLELARILSAGDPPPCDVLFAMWSGEELGLLGSAHWMGSPTVPLDSVVCNLNFDMVGRAGSGTLQILGAGTSPVFAGWMEAAGAAAGLELSVNLSGDGIGGSDHQSFIRSEIPALHFFSGTHTDYHKPSDDVERFEADGAARTTALALDLIARIGAESELPYAEVEREDSTSGQRRQRSTSWNVTFGSVPSYDWDGEGLLINGTSAGSPAERAGLLGGDILMGVGDIEIGDIYDFVYALGVHKPGDVVEVLYLRGEKEERVMLTLGSRELE